MRRPLGNILWERAVLRLHLASICVCDGVESCWTRFWFVAFRLIERNRPFGKGGTSLRVAGFTESDATWPGWTIAFDVAEDDRTLREVFWICGVRPGQESPDSQPARFPARGTGCTTRLGHRR